MSKYYYLIAGLPELTLEDNKLNYTVQSFRTELYPELSKKDRQIIDLVYLKFDNSNLLALLDNKEAQLKELGVYSKDQLLDLIDTVKYGEEQAKGFAPYLVTFVEKYFAEEFDDQDILENTLTGMYYDYASKSKNNFARSWFQYNKVINNLLVAFTCREYKIDYQNQIIGDDEISRQIRHSSARDFGLSTTLDFINQLIRITDESDWVQREKRIDQMRWNWIEEQTFFDYFTIERVFVFLLQVQMIE
ncbi:MAG: DUF2764 family protein, partial [Bacteroides sp.]